MRPKHRTGGAQIALLVAILGSSPVARSAEPEVVRPVATDDAEDQAQSGMVRISTRTPNAVVHIDNVEAGPAPITRYLPEGPHTIRVSADGHNPFVRKIQVKAGKRVNVPAALLPGSGTVEFGVNARGGTVTIDDGEPVPTPVRLSTVTPGEHRYTLSAPGHEPKSGVFTFARGKNVFLFETLTSSAGMFSVNSVPDGATVLLDGTPVGETPLALADVAEGTHLVELQIDGYARTLVAVDTTGGKKGVVDARMKKRGGHLVVKTGSGNAEVRMGGSVLGTGKRVRVSSLQKGRYPIEVVVPDHKVASGRADVRPGGRTVYRADLAKSDDRGPSKLRKLPPLTGRWTFWTAVGAGAAGVGAGVGFAWWATRPVEIPEGDLVVTLP